MNKTVVFRCFGLRPVLHTVRWSHFFRNAPQEEFIMTNVEFAEKINGFLKGSKAKAKKYEDLVAVNFTFIDDMDDIYVAVKDGVLDVAPYHYDDLQANVNGSAENIEKLFSGEIAFDKALAEGLVKVDGDVAKFKALEPLVPAKKAEKKAPAKAEPKPVAKEDAKAPAKTEEKPAAPKAEVKASPAPAKAETKPAAASAEKKPAPAKPAKKHGKK